MEGPVLLWMSGGGVRFGRMGGGGKGGLPTAVMSFWSGVAMLTVGVRGVVGGESFG